MNSSERWWRSFRESQDHARKQAGYLSQARALRAVRPPAVVRRRWWPALAAAAAVILFLAAMVWQRGTHSDLRFSTGGEVGQVGSWIAAPDGSALPLRFSDGSFFQLSAGARARVSAVDSNGARIVVERGGASAMVVHRPASRWLIDVGPFEVTVVGTRFDVSWDPNDEEFRLHLDEGAVLVSGACVHDPRPVAQGHALRVSCKRDREEIVETLGEAKTPKTAVQATPSTEFATSDSPGVLTADAGRAEPAMEAARAAHTVATEVAPAVDVLHSNAWRALASAGRYREALDLVEHHGFDETCRRASGADLLELGDAARLTGRTRRAREAYLAARGKLPGGGRSAYSLGLTAFDQDRDFALAARWFEVYLSEQPAGDLRREAEGRLMEASLRAGDRDQARGVAARYLREYPNGTQATLARQIATP